MVTFGYLSIPNHSSTHSHQAWAARIPRSAAQGVDVTWELPGPVGWRRFHDTRRGRMSLVEFAPLVDSVSFPFRQYAWCTQPGCPVVTLQAKGRGSSWLAPCRTGCFCPAGWPRTHRTGRPFEVRLTHPSTHGTFGESLPADITMSACTGRKAGVKEKWAEPALPSSPLAPPTWP